MKKGLEGYREARAARVCYVPNEDGGEPCGRSDVTHHLAGIEEAVMCSEHALLAMSASVKVVALEDKRDA